MGQLLVADFGEATQPHVSVTDPNRSTPLLRAPLPYVSFLCLETALMIGESEIRSIVNACFVRETMIHCFRR